MDALSTKSYWRNARTPPQLRPEPLPGQVDAAIIGGGITGLTAAIHLRQAGVSVAVLEAGTIGTGTTGGTSAHLDAHPEQGARRLISQYGRDAARTVTSSRMSAIQQIEDWSREFGIECEFQRVPAYWYSEQQSGLQHLVKEAEALATTGLNVSTISRLDLPYPNAGGIRIESQARFHPLKYVDGLARTLQEFGGIVCQHVRAQPPEEGAPCRISTSRGELKAENVLLCSHSAYFGISQLDARIAPYQSYVLAARIAEAFPDGLYWDDAQPYHYLRRARGDNSQLVIVGGEDHKTGQSDEEEALQRLEDYVRARFTLLDIENRWSAELFEPADHLPYIGRVPTTDHLYVATGFSGTGLTFGVVAGRLMADLILGRDCPIADVFSPSRVKPIAAAPDFVKENMNVAKHFIMDRFRGDRIDSIDDIPPGEGKLIIHEGRQMAAYRDPQGALHLLSSVCTHMGCRVAWNTLDRTWDCPCHGGRFSPLGERLYGPPADDLPRLQENVLLDSEFMPGRARTLP